MENQTKKRFMICYYWEDGTWNGLNEQLPNSIIYGTYEDALKQAEASLNPVDYPGEKKSYTKRYEGRIVYKIKQHQANDKWLEIKQA